MKILYVFGGEKASGAEKVIERLITYNKAHVDPHLFISKGNYADNLALNNSSFTKITKLKELQKLNRSSTSKLLYYLFALRNYIFLSVRVLIYIRRQDIKVVHSNTVVPSSYLIPAIFYSRLFNPSVKWIWSDHDIKYFSGFDHKLSGLCTSSFDLTLAVSEAVKNKYQGKQSKKIKLLYNGLNLNEFRHNSDFRKIFRKRYQVSEESIIIAIAGTIEPRKGQLGLINAFMNLQKEFSNTYLLIAGPISDDNPEYGAEMLNIIGKYKKILYLGKTNDMLGFYNGSDILVNNSNCEGSEPLGTTLIEAMACEKIVAASNTGGSKEIINHMINGYLFKPDNIKDLTNTLSDIIKNLKEENIINFNARKTVYEKFNIEAMTRSYNAYTGIFRE